MRILHTESSNGWGGQEIRILREAEGMRKRGHEVVFAVARGGGLVAKARASGFLVYEINFRKSNALYAILSLTRIISKHEIDLVNTHSSLDAWLGGIAARISGSKILRTRHLSTTIRTGLNSKLLYNTLADAVVTTSSAIVPIICEQADISPLQCRSIPTGVDLDVLDRISETEVAAFRRELKMGSDDLLIGTACFVRSWKGINDFLRAAQLLKNIPNLKWVIVGGGYLEEYRPLVPQLGLENIVIFTGHLDNPFPAIAAMDVFLLLSTAHEGVSQASLQAAALSRPLVTTTIGGLPEVCIDGKTGFNVPPFSPEMVAEAIQKLIQDSSLRQRFGKNARTLVEEKFTFSKTLNDMEDVYQTLISS